jgi:hydrogenase small subunit
MPVAQKSYDEVEQRFGVSRREFLTFCTGIAATMGLPAAAAAQVAEALVKKERPSVIWIHGQECTGNSESLLRAEHPTLEKLILDIISLDYHETLFAAAGHQAEAARLAAMEKNKGKYLMVVEGSIPMKDGGIYSKTAGKTSLELVRETAAGAAAIVAMGSCASWGGMPSAGPNPTGAVGVGEALGRTVMTIPGCPPSPYNFLAAVVHFLTFNKLPPMDAKGRPLFAYSRLIHENCERRAHFDAGRFALEFGDEGHRKGYCLYKLGCKGPETYANCPAVLYGDVGCASWPVGTGHPCIGCSEQGIGFSKPIHALADLKNQWPPAGFPRVADEQGTGPNLGGVAAVSAAVGAAVGAGVVLTRRISNQESGAGNSANSQE